MKKGEIFTVPGEKISIFKKRGWGQKYPNLGKYTPLIKTGWDRFQGHVDANKEALCMSSHIGFILCQLEFWGGLINIFYNSVTWASLGGGSLPSRGRRGLAASTTVGFSDQFILSCSPRPHLVLVVNFI